MYSLVQVITLEPGQGYHGSLTNIIESVGIVRVPFVDAFMASQHGQVGDDI